jgi:hypothetical protein
MSTWTRSEFQAVAGYTGDFHKLTGEGMQVLVVFILVSWLHPGNQSICCNKIQAL